MTQKEAGENCLRMSLIGWETIRSPEEVEILVLAKKSENMESKSRSECRLLVEI